MQHFPSELDLSGDLNSLTPASRCGLAPCEVRAHVCRVKMSMLAGDLKAIEGGLFKVSTLLKAPAELPKDAVKAKMEAFHADAQKRYDAVKAKLTATQEKLTKVIKYFGEDASMDADEFFGLLDRFVEMFNVRGPAHSAALTLSRSAPEVIL